MAKEEIAERGIAAGMIREEFARHNIEVKLLLLFGSRARAMEQRESDWDFLVVVDKDLVRHLKSAITNQIRRIFAEKHISVDLIIKTVEEVQKYRDNVGTITYYAVKEGVQV